MLAGGALIQSTVVDWLHVLAVALVATGCTPVSVYQCVFYTLDFVVKMKCN